MKYAFMVVLLSLFVLASCTTQQIGNTDSAITGNIVLDENNNFVLIVDNGTDTGNQSDVPSGVDDQDQSDTSQNTGQDDGASFDPDNSPSKQYYSEIIVTEGDLVEFSPEVIDPDGDDISITFSAPLSEDGVWQTNIGDAGTYEVEMTASDGLLVSKELVLLVVERMNRAPTIECDTVQYAKEGEAHSLGCKIYDVEGDEFTVSYEGFRSEAFFTPTFTEAGEQLIVVRATDSFNQENEVAITLFVEDVNREPLVYFESPELTVLEGDLVTIPVTVADPDGEDVSVSYSTPFSQDGTWQTGEGDAGTYVVTVSAFDGVMTSEREISVIVSARNEPPALLIGDTEIIVEEGDLITLDVSAFDPEDEEVTLTVSGWMNELSYQTTFTDAGEYEVYVTASDGEKETTATVLVTVLNVNRPPVFVQG
ncbi:MAG: hypothetical protein H6502_03725 [Candidatus Woesearchaeota archaeon]|nr:MAG: hypothetical protein H6502_03725 [Candidatus Woesearchaeota archaeon]